MPKRAVGIDISDRSIEIVAISGRNPSVIESAMRVALPAGLIERGDVQDMKGVVKVLTAMLDSMFGEKRGKTRVNVSLPEAVVFSRVFPLPSALDGEQSAKALTIGAAETFPISPGENLAYDFREVDDNGSVRKFMFATAQENIIKQYIDILEAASAEPVIIEPESMALARALVPYGTNQSVMVADIGARNTVLACYDSDGNQLISSSVPAGGEMFTAEIEKRMQLSMQEAESLKRRAGFDEDAEDGRVLMILQQPLEELVNEIKKTLNYIKENKQASIDTLVLAGGTSMLPKMAEYLTLLIDGVKVVSGDAFSNVEISEEAVLPKSFNKHAVLFSTAIGLGIRGVETRGHPGLNFHPAERQSDRHGGVVASVRAFMNKISSLMPTSKKKPAKKTAATKSPSKAGAKKASKKPSATAKKKKTTAKTARAKPAVSKKKAPTKKEVAESPVEVAREPAPEETVVEQEVPVIPEEMVEEVPEAPEAAVVAEEPELDMSEGFDVVEEAIAADAKGATPDNPERDFGMGVGELLGSSVTIGGEDDEDDDTEEAGVDISEVVPDSADRLSVESILSGKGGGRGSGPASHREHGSKWKIIVPIVVFLLALVVIAAGAGMFRSMKDQGISKKFLSGIMSIFVSEEKQPVIGENGMVANGPDIPETVAINVLVTSGELEDDLAMPAVQSRIIETDVVAEGSFEATGEAQADDARSVGTITIVNELSRTFSFVARTRFLSEDGVLFRMSEPANIPAEGTVDVEVYADELGPDSDIGPATFTIPGLSEALQESVYGRSDASMSGGDGMVAAVSEEDIEAAKAALMEELLDEARENFKVMVTDDEVVLDGLITSKETESEFPELATIGSSFKASMSVQFRALLIPSDELGALIDNKLVDVLPEGVDSSAYQLGEPMFTLEAYPEPDKANIRVEASIESR